ncbi:MAG: YciC family protein [Patescibacteria group bacterium]
MKKFLADTKTYLAFGWKTFKACPWLFIAVPLVLFAISLGIGLVEGLLEFFFGKVKMELLIDIEGIVTTLLMGIGVTTLYLRAHDHVDKAELRDLWNPKPFWRYLGVCFLGSIPVILGLVFFIVPGIIIALAFSFAGILVIEKGMGPIEALKESVRLTKGHRFELFKLAVATLVINILGLCALIVGLFVTVPVSQLAFTHAYRTIAKNAAA